MTAKVSTAVTAALLAVTAVTAAFAVLDLQGPARVIVTLLFLFLVPGWSVIAFFRPSTSSLTWALVIAVSVAIDLLGAQLMLLTTWRPALASVFALVVCAVLLGFHLVTARRTVGGHA
ncbi:hypothetical protein [Amycolatopsis sp. NBC_01480]|uniref:hypothetical protein n=1 Tax=Amycolatopsis sp. NBC_01480 TaxID=2903562 RepID=UPI002E2DF8D9|nr:hypothetical protein [Amycolatopsis sp. NBC_01480]